MKQKTKFFKFIAFAISFILLLTSFSTLSVASITTYTNTGTIKVSNIEAGVTVSLYQLTTVNYDYEANQPKDPAYSWVSGVYTWISNSYEYSSYTDLEVFSEAITTNSAEESFYSALAAAIKSEEITLSAKTLTADGTATYPVDENNLSGSVTFTGCEMGTYLVLIENGYMVYTPSVVNLTPEYSDGTGWTLAESVEVTVKSTNPQISKEITNEGSIGLNDTVSYKIEADVPNYPENSISKSYYISDKLSAGLTLDSSTIEVYGQNSSGQLIKLTVGEELIEGVDYILTLETTRPGTAGASAISVDFLLTFNYDEIKSYTKIVVTYDATLDATSEALTGGAGITNDAYLDYSNNPYVSGGSLQSQDVPDDEVPTIYLYGIQVNKIDKTEHTLLLEGAEFELQDENENALYFVADEEKEGVYYLAASSEVDGATTVLAVGSSDSENEGILYIYGLGEGTYTLVETKAPDGYTKSNTTVSIVIKDENNNGMLDVEDGQTETSNMYIVDFENSTGFQLPVTGGMGIVAFIACGIVLIGLGAVMFISVMKKRRANQ